MPKKATWFIHAYASIETEPHKSLQFHVQKQCLDYKRDEIMK